MRDTITELDALGKRSDYDEAMRRMRDAIAATKAARADLQALHCQADAAYAIKPAQCLGLTATGKRCSRTTGLDASGYCSQHAGKVIR